MNEGMENLKQIAELEEKCMKDKKYTAEEIREAVDIATGDDGFRSKEVISILETNVKQNTEEYLKERITKNDNKIQA